MVRALYPQKWIPYHYLGPLAFDKWDTLAALRLHHNRDTVLGRLSREMLMLLSEYDEMVPLSMGETIFNAATLGHDTTARKVVIPKALHENAWMKQRWATEMQKYLTCI